MDTLCESYTCLVYYDFMNDDKCIVTRYRFTTRQLAEQFKNTKTNFIYVDNISYMPTTQKDVNVQYWNRPCFDNLESALNDLNDLMKLDDNYIHKKDLHHEPLRDMQTLQMSEEYENLILENKKLKNENENLKRIIGQSAMY